MNDDSSVFQHFRADERPFIERVEDWLGRVYTRHQLQLTDFLNPREQFILRTLTQRTADVVCFFDGGYEQAEYQRCLLAPDYWHPQPEDMDLCFLEITGATQFQPLKHRDYLGALLNLGIKRDKIGDLLVTDDRCQLVTNRQMGTYIRLNLTHVHRVHVTVEEIDRTCLTLPENTIEEQSVIVASTRLDAVLSATFPLSRSKIVPLIQASKCKVNWKVEENPSATVEPGDTLSLRGYGRVYVLALEGETKRGRIRLTIGKPL